MRDKEAGMSTKEKCVEFAKKISKTRANYTCEKCGKSKDQGWQQHGAHIIPVSYAKTAALPENILDLCGSCHSMGPTSAHQNPIPFSRWFDDKWPGRYDELWTLARTYSQNPFPKIQWDEELIQLKATAKELGIKP